MLTLRELDEFLRSGGVILLPNHHGAQHWQDAIGRLRWQRDNNTVVAAPAIYAVDLWLQQLWQTASLHFTDDVLGARVLSAAEEDLLWQELLSSSPQGSSLLNTTGTARQLREALRLLNLWQLTPADIRQHLQLLDDDDSQDDRVLAWRWLQQFQRECSRQQRLSAGAQLAALLNVLRAHATSAAPLLPSRLLWLGFDSPPPLYRSLQATLNELGVASEYASGVDATPDVRVHAFVDSACEYRAAAQWAADILAADATARIGIVCPNLPTLRPQLQRTLEQHLPAAELYCSATTTLAEHAFFNSALQVLTLSDSEADSLQLCQLLRSPWLVGSNDETDARSALELRLRNQGELITQTASLRELSAQRERRWHSPQLAAALLQLQIQQQRQRKPQTLQEWLDQFRQSWQLLLDSSQLNLPSHRTLQAAWQQWLDAIQASSPLFARMSRERAIGIVAALAQNCHLPNGRSNAAVRVLTPVEAAGLQFSHLWVMQLHADAWPGELHPNPCLPLSMQRALQMPAVDAAHELQRAQQQLQQWLGSAEITVVLSYPMHVDELPVTPSPLLPARLTPGDVQRDNTGVPAALHPAFAQFPSRQLVISAEPRHLAPADAPLQGPGALLAAQAACPFRAFALHRLGARELQSFRYGLPASAIGELLHHVLQQFWSTLRDSAVLSHDTPRVEAERKGAITAALQKLAMRYPHTVTPRFRELEQQRLETLLSRWLELERTRRPFLVELTEAELKWQHANLELTLRLDRVDRTEHGLVVVDYKTGKITAADWEAQRPQQPQLLLYQQALRARGDVSGLLYAHIALDTLEYVGVTAADEGNAEWTFSDNSAITATTWPQLQQHWQQVLQSLAQEYLDGLVSVAPQFANSCNYCHLPTLCRIDDAYAEQEEP